MSQSTFLWRNFMANPARNLASTTWNRDVTDGCVYFNLTTGHASYIYDQIGDYSKRNLTKPPDRLNGFLGMLNYSNAIQRFRHLWSVPIPPDKGFVRNGKVLPFYQPQYSNASFVKGLFFHTSLSFNPSARVTRIPTLPSWSWTGWDGPVFY